MPEKCTNAPASHPPTRCKRRNPLRRTLSLHRRHRAHAGRCAGTDPAAVRPTTSASRPRNSYAYSWPGQLSSDLLSEMIGQMPFVGGRPVNIVKIAAIRDGLVDGVAQRLRARDEFKAQL